MKLLNITKWVEAYQEDGGLSPIDNCVRLLDKERILLNPEHIETMKINAYFDTNTGEKKEVVIVSTGRMTKIYMRVTEQEFTEAIRNCQTI